MKKKIVLLLVTVLAMTCIFAACAKVYTVTFDLQNGEQPVVVPYTKDFALPENPTNGSKIFCGWYTDAACTTGNEWVPPTSLEENITVYAKWMGTSLPDGDSDVYVIFDAQNGEAVQKIKFDANFVMPQAPTNGDKIFGGWYTDKDCTDGNQWIAPIWLTADITVYAKWTDPAPLPVEKDVYVVFDPQNGSSVIIVKFDKDFALPEEPTNGDKIFGGWYTDKDCTDGNEWTIPEALEENISVYAKWEEDVPELADVSRLAAQYADDSAWNFEVSFVMGLVDSDSEPDTICVDGYRYSFTSLYDEGVFTHYIDYESGVYYYDNGDGTWTTYTEADNDYATLIMSLTYFDLTTLSTLKFTEKSGALVAVNPQEAGVAILGDWGDDCFWNSLEITLQNGKISKIAAIQTDTSEDYGGTYEFVLTFSKYGRVKVVLPQISTPTPVDSVTISPSELSLKVGDTSTITADASGDVSWTTSNANVAVVANGTVTAISAGTATITATCGTATATCKVTVTEDSGSGGSNTGSSATLSLLGTSTRVSYSETLTVYSANGITYSNIKSNASNNNFKIENETWATRAYAGSVIKIEYPQMTSIKITLDGAEYSGKTYIAGFDDMTVAGATIVRNGTVVTITFASPVNSFTSAELSSQVRIISVEVSGGSTGGSGNSGESGGTTGGNGGEDNPVLADVSQLAAQYADDSAWNFEVSFVMGLVGENNAANTISVAGNKYAYSTLYTEGLFTDYVDYQNGVYYYDNGDGTWTTYTEADNDYATLIMSLTYFDLTTLSTLKFTEKSGSLVAVNPQEAGVAILGDWGEDCTWDSLEITVQNGKIVKIEAIQTDTSEDYAGTYEFILTFTKYGQVSVTLPESGDPVTPTDSVTLSPTSLSLKVGATATITPTASGSVFWTTSNANVAVVANGTVTAISAGTATITATCGTATATCKVTVTEDSGVVTPSGKDAYLASVVTAPQAGTNYKLAAWSQEKGKILYWTGETTANYTWYMTTTDDINAAVDVQVKIVNGGYYLYAPSTGKYLEMTERSDKAGSGTLALTTSTPSAVMMIDNSGIITVVGPTATIYLGVSNGRDTISANNVSYISDTSVIDVSQYPARLIAVGGSGNSGESGGTTGGNGSGNSNVMPNQTYNSATFDYDNLQDKLLAYETAEYGDAGAIGLPSTGSYNALVVPVKFANTTISQQQLNNLNIAFNGTSAQTGWESVKTYYNKSSYGKLNLSFDIWGVTIGAGDVYASSKNYGYYEKLTDSDGNANGCEVILLEVLSYLESRLDLTKYDTNNDGSIDAVYIIYSAPVDYEDGNSMWWAYVTWYSGDDTFDGLLPYYYMFTGLDFMDEETRSGHTVDVNAETYIHETGHLLALDDYYDYAIGTGSDRGMGGVAMQDFNIGDQDIYSKVMMGWVKPTVITQTTTFTIDISNADTSDNCVMLLLDSNNSYFCEYLLIDLYSATGLNEQFSAGMYNGVSYGARIYHVSSWCNNPYSDDYGSFTNYNNSVSSIPLIKLVEADGENTKNNNTNQGDWAEGTDLWQTGAVFGNVFPNYTRNDGKTLNFNISFDSVTATTATITVTFAE